MTLKHLLSSAAIAVLVFAAIPATAQIPEDFVPSELNQPGQQYPMVNSQGYVRLRVYAPQAQSVICTLAHGMANEVRPGRSPIRLDERFQTVLCDELVPYIDANFKTKAKRSDRAMAGLSMGGMETHTITLARPEMFGWFGLLSGGIYTPEELKDIKDVKGIFIGCGSKEFPEGIRKSAAALQEAGYNAKGYVSPDTAHEFLTWRRCFLDMAPMLFVR